MTTFLRFALVLDESMALNTVQTPVLAVQILLVSKHRQLQHADAATVQFSAVKPVPMPLVALSGNSSGGYESPRPEAGL